MALNDWFHAEFRQLETRAAMAEDVSAALVELIAKVERATKAMAPATWRQEVEGVRDALRAQFPVLSEATSPMQLRKRRLTEATIAELTDLVARPPR